MKVLFFSHEFPPDLGGAGYSALNYVELLGRLGFNVSVLTRKHGSRDFSNASFKVIEAFRIRALWPLAYLFRRTNFDNFDIIVLNDPSAIFFAGLFFNDKLLSRSVVFFHGQEIETIYQAPSAVRRLFRFGFFVNRVLNKCKNIIAVSKFLKNKVLSVPSISKSSNKIEVFYSPINTEVFRPNPSPSFRQSYGIPEGSFVLLTVARVVKGKGLLRKLRILKGVIDRNRVQLVWCIVGDGPYLAEFQKEVAFLGMEGVVKILGSVPRPRLPELYSNVDLFWLLSDFEESFGLVYLEAMACGCPVMGLNKGGVKEACFEDVVGALVESDLEAEEKLLVTLKAKKNSESLEKIVERYNRRSMVRVEQFFNSLTKSNDQSIG